MYVSPKNHTMEIGIENLIATSGTKSLDLSSDYKADENYEVLSNKQRPGAWDDLWGE